jgi:precorrin-6B methylase 2
MELAEALLATCKPGGRLITAGIIIDRADEVRTALEASGLVEIQEHQMGDWVCIEGVRPSAAKSVINGSSDLSLRGGKPLGSGHAVANPRPYQGF